MATVTIIDRGCRKKQAAFSESKAFIYAAFGIRKNPEKNVADNNSALTTLRAEAMLTARNFFNLNHIHYVIASI